MADNTTVDALLAEANTTINAPRSSGVTAVQFLDGPLAGQQRTVRAEPNGRPTIDRITAAVPRPVMWVDEEDLKRPAGNTVTYTIKRSRFRRGPKWVAALGEKVGDRVQAVQIYSLEARRAMGWDAFSKIVERYARDALTRTCAEAGLVPDDVHKVFDGSRRDAEGRIGPWPSLHEFEQEEAARAALAVAREHHTYGDELQYVVFHAVAMPAPAPEVEAVAQWE
ncbi:hypothetical protein SEA_EDUGATOR_78 [Mycobacterium phage Edugator]|uniref:Uncharacterized protein n=3 Tax=Kratiovirus larva TaxID=1056831 RepID=A0A222ZMY6_9CAUD|nr:hypothetical protein CL76_gp21 [Mycobacterium phage Larva]AEL19729.1 hypothetical protein LARVA_81 [Mycobacterium phage Larva]ASR85775.1 hypothetical protein SEA_EDUGATOR_78 [Mycobacterium phage Edugator]QQV92682.1 hypothetical protein SEA_PSYCHO_80 [Mycobacterium phage Psycho]WAB09763.1 hypothetical protein SEA_DADOSKY_82 [Mycobacterium phage Dadosky]